MGPLRAQLAATLDGAYIPGGLKDAIERDPVLGSSLSMEPIEDKACNFEDKRTVHDLELLDLLQQVKEIFQSAILCSRFGRDENAWCFGVVWPLLKLAIRLHGKQKWRPESV